MKTAAKWVKVSQGPTTMVAIFKEAGSARNVIVKHRQLVPVIFRKGRQLNV